MKDYYDDIKCLLATSAIILILLLLTGCKTTKYVPVEVTRDVYHNTTDTVRDSIFHDVFHDVYVKGDTVYNNKTEYLYKYKYINKTDTLAVIDSIPYTVTTVEKVYVEAELHWWQTALMWLGGITLFLAVITITSLIKYNYETNKANRR